ncbi:MAG: hypothetical protein ACRDU4_16220 [Mycobacterium sp.]
MACEHLEQCRHHTVEDPAAVGLELAALGRVWTVGRDVIRLGLTDPDLGDRATGCECRGCWLARADREMGECVAANE